MCGASQWPETEILYLHVGSLAAAMNWYAYSPLYETQELIIFIWAELSHTHTHLKKKLSYIISSSFGSLLSLRRPQKNRSSYHLRAMP